MPQFPPVVIEGSIFNIFPQLLRISPREQYRCFSPIIVSLHRASVTSADEPD